jgi:formamidopyrimidine-DNA glycosylase
MVSKVPVASAIDMPEGHTIHRIARDHSRLLAGEPLRVSSPQGRFEEGAARLDGRTLCRIDAHGKHLLYRFDGALTLHVHLGLFGKYRVHRAAAALGAPTDEPDRATAIDPPAPVGAVRLRLAGSTTTIDLAGPTACELFDPHDEDALLARLGPDPLRADADPARFVDRVGRSRQAIGLLLMDQSVIAGIGNVFRAEALFVNGIHPEQPGRSLLADQHDALWDTVRSMLRQGVKDNRIVTVDPKEVGIARSKITRRDATYVYKRDTCLRCGSPIQRWAMGGRTCYACPGCQRR